MKDVNTSSSNQPLFILSPGRSFSSVVSSVIGQHPDAFGLPEVNLFRFPTIGDLLDSSVIGAHYVAAGLRRALSELMYGEQTKESLRKVNAWLEDRRRWAGYRVFEEICQLASPRFVVDKSPTNITAESFHRLFEAFPNARYLHLARHPRPTGRSHQRAKSERKSMPGAAPFEGRWYRAHERILAKAVLLRPDQYILVQGERFLEDPDTVLRQICEWLEIRCDQECLDLMKRPEDSPFSTFGPDGARTGHNPGFLENPKLRAGKIREETLDAPLEWVEDRVAHFSESTKMLANILGYR